MKAIKKIILIFILVFIVLLGFNRTVFATPEKPITIVLDPGHGGYDPRRNQ